MHNIYTPAYGARLRSVWDEVCTYCIQSPTPHTWPNTINTIYIYSTRVADDATSNLVEASAVWSLYIYYIYKLIGELDIAKLYAVALSL